MGEVIWFLSFSDWLISLSIIPSSYSSTINNSQSMKRAQMSIERWMDKEDVVYIYNGVLLGNQKEWNHAICNYVDGAGGYYAKWN